MTDAIVVGAGPNGLVAANRLADAGWDVVVLEANDEPGGAVRTAEVTAPGFRNDLFSAFYPLAAVSPVIKALDLERHGLESAEREIRWVSELIETERSTGPSAATESTSDPT